MEAALEVASNLLPADRREVEEGHGVDAKEALIDAVQKPSCVYFVVPNGKTAGMAGVDDGGQIVDKRNKVHLKLLQFLGFKFLREFKHGPNQLTFIEFCRVLRC